MKQLFLFTFFLLAVALGKAQVTVYLKLTPGSNANIPALVDENPGTTHSGQILLTTVSNSEYPKVSLASSSGGTSSVKVVFDSIVFSKPVGVNTSSLFVAMSNTSPFKFVEVSYYNTSNQIVYRQTLSTAYVTNMKRAAASCTTDCPGIVEDIAMIYGTEVFTYYTTPGNLATGVSRGWDAIRNMRMDDPTYSAIP